MVDRPPINVQVRSVTVTAAALKTRVDFESTVSTSDTITMQNIGTLSGAAILRKDTGATLTATIATNVITVTTIGLTNVDVIGTAYST